MFKRKGKVAEGSTLDEPLIENTDRNVYKVSQIMLYIWKQLDGETSLGSISNDIKSIAKDESLDTYEITKSIAQELMKVHLIQKNT